MSVSILNNIKKVLDIEPDDDSFDQDVLMHINTAFAVLNQIGLGPQFGFDIEDATPTWDAFIGTDKRLNPVKTYVLLYVRSIFDPATNSYLVQAQKEQMQEQLTRLSMYRESLEWVNPFSVSTPTDLVLDGGPA